MTAADLLRQALEDAPDGLHVAEDAYGDPTIWDAEDLPVLEVYDDGRVVTLRLIGLLLAAAPHLADLLDPQGTPAADVIEHIRDAIEEVTR